MLMEACASGAGLGLCRSVELGQPAVGVVVTALVVAGLDRADVLPAAEGHQLSLLQPEDVDADAGEPVPQAVPGVDGVALDADRLHVGLALLVPLVAGDLVG